jgi:hypothetical protein
MKTYIVAMSGFAVSALMTVFLALTFLSVGEPVMHPSLACATDTVVSVSGTPSIFNSQYQANNMRCNEATDANETITEKTFDVTDVPVSAVCLHQTSGTCDDVLFVSGNSNNWYGRGSSLDAAHISRDQGNSCYVGCVTITSSPFDSDPSHFKGKIWVQNIKWMPDASNNVAIGNELDGIVHNEFHGELYSTGGLQSGNCYAPDPQDIPCIYMSTTTLKIVQGGTDGRTPVSISWPVDGSGYFRHVVPASTPRETSASAWQTRWRSLDTTKHPAQATSGCSQHSLTATRQRPGARERAQFR